MRRDIIIDTGRTPPRELYRGLDWDNLGKHNLEKVIKLFWWCTRYDVWSWYDFIREEWHEFKFEPVFDIMEDILYEKLGEHNYLPTESEQRRYYRDMMRYEKHMFDSLIEQYGRYIMTREQHEKGYEELNEEWKEKQRRYDEPPYYDLNTALRGNEWWERDGIEIIVDELGLGYELITTIMNMDLYYATVYDRILKYYKRLKARSYFNKIVFMDELIDLYHRTGYVTGRYVDIPLIREEFEDEYI